MSRRDISSGSAYDYTSHEVNQEEKSSVKPSKQLPCTRRTVYWSRRVLCNETIGAHCILCEGPRRSDNVAASGNLSPNRKPPNIPLRNPASYKHIVQQPESAFLTKLPLEIRREIYKHVLGARTVHERDGHFRICPNPHCTQLFCNPNLGRRIGIPTDMLRTCRQM